MSFFENSVFFGVTISIVAYGVGCVLKDKLKMDIFNPVLISIVAVIAVLACAHIDYDVYYSGAQYLSYLLTPATVCLAVPLYEKIELLKEHWKAIVAGILSGVLTTLLCVLAMSLIFGFSHEEYVTFLPKSITGVLGNIIAPFVCKAFRIQDPIARGIAIGTASHAIGTSKAMEMGEIEGAMSSLSIVVSGLWTVVGASIFAQFI